MHQSLQLQYFNKMYSRNHMAKVTDKEFGLHLNEQLRFLERSLKIFIIDEAEAKQAANTIAKLLLDPTNLRKDSRTKSLLFTHMNQKDIQFLETKAPKGMMFGFHINPGKSKSKLIWDNLNNLVNPYSGLVAKELIEVEGKIILKYVPLFKYNNDLSNEVHAPMIDAFPWGFGRSVEVIKRGFIDFDDWWNSKIYEDNDGYSLTRKQLIINVRNKDGGSHIDDELDENYARMKKKDALTMNIDGQFQQFNNIPAYSSVIQIAWETFVSIKKAIESSANT
jgi:hypothetical protein